MLKIIFYFVGKQHESRKNWEESTKWYLKAYSDNKAIVNYRLGFCYEKQKDYENAVYFFKKAISLKENKIHWYLHLVHSLMALNEDKEALYYLKLSIDLDKNKKYHNKHTALSAKLHHVLPAENIYIQDIQKFEGEELAFLYTITGTVGKNFNINKIILYIKSRTNTLETTPPHSLSLEPHQCKIDSNSFFTASFLLDLNRLKIDSDVILYTFDFTLKADKEYRIELMQDTQEVWYHENYDFIPYRTQSRNYSLMAIRKTSKFTVKDNVLNITFFLFKINYKGGLSKVIIDLANALADAGHNITLTTMVLTNRSNMYPISKKVNFNYVSISAHHSTNTLPLDSYATKESISPFFLHDLSTYFLKSSTDILYTPIYASPLLLSIMSTVPASTLTIVGDHSGSRHETYNTLLNNQNNIEDKKFNTQVKRTLFFKNITRINAIHLINPLVKEVLQKETNKTLVTIPNIIDFKTKSENYKPFNKRKNKIILVGSLAKVKNFDTVIRAFAKLQKIYPSWKIEIYGEGVEEHKLNLLIKTLKMTHKIALKGFTSNIQSIYENSMVHLSASHKESFGLTMVESMNCGSITISTKQTIGAKYLINHEETGFLASDNTEDGIYKILDTVLSLIEKEDPLLVKIQEDAYRHSHDFNADSITQQWMEAVQSLQKEKDMTTLN